MTGVSRIACLVPHFHTKDQIGRALTFVVIQLPRLDQPPDSIQSGLVRSDPVRLDPVPTCGSGGGGGKQVVTGDGQGGSVALEKK